MAIIAADDWASVPNSWSESATTGPDLRIWQNARSHAGRVTTQHRVGISHVQRIRLSFPIISDVSQVEQSTGQEMLSHAGYALLNDEQVQ